MSVSVVAVCRRPEKQNSTSEALSIVVTAGALQPANVSENVATAANFLSEGPLQQEPDIRSIGREDFRLATRVQDTSPVAADGVDHGTRGNVTESCMGAVAAGGDGAAFCCQQPKPGVGLRSLRAASLQHNKSPAALTPADDGRMDGQDGVPEGAATATVAKPLNPKPDITVLASAVAASKLGLVEQLGQALATCGAVAFAKDTEDRTCLHYAAGYGHEECVSLLLEHRSETRVRDTNGDLPLHFAAIHGHPMCAYNITKACPAACLTRNYRGQTPVEVAVACERGEVLNAMLLACAGDGSAGPTVQAMRKLLSSGAVPDTWAPNGSSALMLAAAANGTEALVVLLEAGATLELQDALGRSALMFAAGNSAKDTLLALLEAGACISQRDRRGRNVLDYAPAGSEVRRLLQARLDELEAVANQRQRDLLASLGEAGEAATGGNTGGEGKGASGGGKKKKHAANPKKVTGASGTSAAAPKSSLAAAASASANSTSAAGGSPTSATPATAGPLANRSINSGSTFEGTTQAGCCSGPGSSVGASGCAAAGGAGAAKRSPGTAQGKDDLQLPGSGCSANAKVPCRAATACSTAAVAMGDAAVGGWTGAEDVSGVGCGGADSLSEPSNAWQTVSSQKCASKQRQQHHPQPHYHPQSQGGSGSALAAGWSGGASTLGRTGGSKTFGTHYPVTKNSGGGGEGRGSLPRSRGPSGGSASPLHEASAAGAGVVAAGVAASAAVSTANPVVRKLAAEGSAAAVPAASATLGAMCGFKAALLGLDPSPTPAPAPVATPAAAQQQQQQARFEEPHPVAPAQAVAAVHLTAPPIITPASAAASSSNSSFCKQQPSAAAAAAGSGAPGERRPAWGGVKLAPRTPGTIVEVAGCSPRSYPPLGAGTVTSLGSGASSAATGQTRPNAPQASTAVEAPKQCSTLSRSQSQSQSQPQAQLQAAVAESYAESASAAAASGPPSIAESESSGTSASTRSNGAAGASSPRSFGRNWTRPNPVDVLLQAALAAAAADGGGSDSYCGVGSGGARRPGHSKTSSTTSCSHLSVDGAALSPLDAVLSAPLPPPPPLPPPGAPSSLSACGGGGGGLSLGSPPGGEVRPPGGEVRPPGGRCGGSRDSSSAASAGPSSQLAASAAAAAAAGGAGSGAGKAAATGAGAGAAKVSRSGAAPGGKAGGKGTAAAVGVKVAAASSFGCSSSAVANLRGEKELLQRQLRQAEQRHSQELAAVMMDAELNEAAVVDRALAQERLRITANLLAIGLCPQAILAVITPPGHGLDVRQLLAGTATTVGAGASSASTAAATSAVGLPGSGSGLGQLTPQSTAPPQPSAVHRASGVGAGRSSVGGVGSGGCAGRSSSSGGSGGCDSSSGLASTGAAAPGITAGIGTSGSGSGSSSSLWDDCCIAATAARGDDHDELVSRLPVSLAPSPTPAIAIPSSPGPLAAVTTSLFGYSAHSSRLQSFGSPAGLCGVGGRGGGGGLIGSFGAALAGTSLASFGSTGGLVGSLCAGLGFGMLSVGGPCVGGMLAAAAEDGEQEVDGEMDLPACGDISALLAMSDDDDA